ncbi:MAG: hypothetical protein QXS57_07380 [Candidatus Caldarchaeum sp.]
MSGPAWSKALAIGIAVVFAAAAAFFLLPRQRTADTGDGQSDLPLEFVQMHLETFGRRDVALILNNYAGDAEVVWSGESGGLTGRYRGFHAIRAFLTVVLTNSDRVELRAVDVSGKVLQDGSVEIKSLINVSGHNAIIGAFEGDARATYILAQTPEGWRIKLEAWDFNRFDAEGAGATVFPQWAALYGSRKTLSPDPVKDFFWRISDLAPMALAAVFAAMAFYCLRIHGRPVG